MSGGQAGAENGVLTVMCGGSEDAYAGAEPVIAAYARMCKLLGPAGSGQLTKMVNQICIAGLVEGLSEGIHFAKKSGLDVQAVIDTISKGAAQSWQMENRYKTMNDGKFDFGFAVEWMRKDLSICLAEARRNGANLPVTALVDQFYSEVEKMGGKRWDTSSLLARLRALSAATSACLVGECQHAAARRDCASGDSLNRMIDADWLRPIIALHEGFSRPCVPKYED